MTQVKDSAARRPCSRNGRVVYKTRWHAGASHLGFDPTSLECRFRARREQARGMREASD